MGAPQFAVYVLCFLTGGLCAWLLLKAYSRRRDRLLLWTCLYFCFLTLNSFLTLMDFFVLPAYDLTIVRAAASLVAVGVLLYAFIWELR